MVFVPRQFIQLSRDVDDKYCCNFGGTVSLISLMRSEDVAPPVFPHSANSILILNQRFRRADSQTCVKINDQFRRASAHFSSIYQ